jgi:hypothetical protein
VKPKFYENLLLAVRPVVRQLITTRKRQTLDKSTPQTVRALLTSEAPQASEQRMCLQCGSAMQRMTATFVRGRDQCLTLPLPVCVKCDPEQLDHSLKGWMLRSDMA